MSIPSVSPASFAAEVLASEVPVVIDFTAPWCAPCRALKPVLEHLAQRHAGAVKVVQVDTDQHPDLAVKFDVRGVPTLAVVAAGKHVDGMRGFQGKRAVEQLFERVIK